MGAAGPDHAETISSFAYPMANNASSFHILKFYCPRVPWPSLETLDAALLTFKLMRLRGTSAVSAGGALHLSGLESVLSRPRLRSASTGCASGYHERKRQLNGGVTDPQRNSSPPAVCDNSPSLNTK